MAHNTNYDSTGKGATPKRVAETSTDARPGQRTAPSSGQPAPGSKASSANTPKMPGQK